MGEAPSRDASDEMGRAGGSRQRERVGCGLQARGSRGVMGDEGSGLERWGWIGDDDSNIEPDIPSTGVRVCALARAALACLCPSKR